MYLIMETFHQMKNIPACLRSFYNILTMASSISVFTLVQIPMKNRIN